MIARFTRPVNSARCPRADTPFSEVTSADTGDIRRVPGQEVHVVVLAVELAELGR
jgi:hypothetical protein